LHKCETACFGQIDHSPDLQRYEFMDASMNKSSADKLRTLTKYYRERGGTITYQQCEDGCLVQSSSSSHDMFADSEKENSSL
jgi:hypothetical protein